MTRKKVYLLIQTILCILLCILLSIAVIRIYREGVQVQKAGDYLAWIYTREKAAERFAPISPLFFGAIGFMIAGLVLGLKDDRLDQPVPDAEVMRDLYSRNVTDPTPQMTAERAKQKKLRSIGIAAAAVCAVPVIIYMVNPAHYDGSSPAALDTAFLQMLVHIVPWIAIGFGFLCVTETLREKSMDREVKMAKDVIKSQRDAAKGGSEKAADSNAEDAKAANVKTAHGKTAYVKTSGSEEISDDTFTAGGQTAGAAPAEKHTMLNVVRAAVLVAAVILIIHGVSNGSMNDVLVKATNICTECIGLG